MNRWHRPAGSAARDGLEVAMGPPEAGWEHTGLQVVSLTPGESRVVSGHQYEWLVLPLSGSVIVECEGRLLSLTGRAGPFTGPTDYAYVPVGATFTLTSPRGGRVALPHARASEPLPFRRLPAEAGAVELRGAGHCSRQVNNFAMETALDAEAIIACEVLTPAGNWSSYPPHKHDQDRPDETALEEIYYFELRADRNAHGSHRATADKADADADADADAEHSARSNNAFGFLQVYGDRDSADEPINVLARVGNGDVVLVPHGWHGPAMAPPGYDMYYLNVMAGPGSRREWLARDDPDHSWVRDTWASQKADPRLPFGLPQGGQR
jgi:5-deoxy-glucuronate isomerase